MFNFVAEVRMEQAPGGLVPVNGGAPRSQILAFQDWLLRFPQGDYPLRHFFAENQYGREITIPPGQLVVGKIHKHSHLNIISKGECTVVTEFGSYRIRAPHIFTSDPGTKRALYTHSETIWTTIHTTRKTDLLEIEEEIIAPTFEAYDAFAKTLSVTTKPELQDAAWGV